MTNPPIRALMIADAQSTGKEIEIPVFININKAGSF